MCNEVAVMLGGSKCVSRSGQYMLGGGSYIGMWQFWFRRC